MSTHRNLAIALLWLVVLNQGVQASEVQSRIGLRWSVQGESGRLDSLRYTNGFGDRYSVSRLSLLLSNLEWVGVDGERQAVEDAYLWFDIDRRQTEATVGSLPPFQPRALCFHVGLNPSIDTADPTQWPGAHALNPNRNGLHWGWQGGYVFLALEGRFQRQGASKAGGYSYHLAKEPIPVSVALPSWIDNEEPWDITLEFDIGRLFGDREATGFVEHGRSTHSRDDDPIAARLRRSVSEAFRIQDARPRLAPVLRPASEPIQDLPQSPTPYPFTFSSAFPLPDLPRDNPLIQERVLLGTRLFHESDLSQDQTLSCADCHRMENGLADKAAISPGIDGRLGSRNAMPLWNLAWKSHFFWDGRAGSLREQVLGPIQDPNEMGANLELVVERLQSNPSYRRAFRRAFSDDQVTVERMALALESFLLTLVSDQSKWDLVRSGRAQFTPAEARGQRLFNTEYDPGRRQFGADCFHCHSAPLFTNHGFHDNGLEAAPKDVGRAAVTGRSSDVGKMATPSLRNVELTAPYMRDGRFNTLEDVLAHYGGGVRESANLDPNMDKHPTGGVPLSDRDQDDLVAFLRTLTDRRLIGKQSAGREIESVGQPIARVEGKTAEHTSTETP